MDFFKMRYNNSTKKVNIVDKPENHSIYKANDGKLYFLGMGKYDSTKFSYLKSETEYYVGFEIAIIDDLLKVYKNLFFISFENEGIFDIVKCNCKNPQVGIINIYESILWELFMSTDNESLKGKKILLQNLISDYDPEINNLPEELTNPTKIADLQFCYEYQPYKKDYVPFEQVVGFAHGSVYDEISWVEAYFHLHRMYTKNYQYMISPEYYSQLESGSIEPDDMSFIKIDDEYYVSGGAHRSTVAKLIRTKGLYANVRYYKTAEFYKNSYYKIKNFGFNVELYGNEFTAYNDIISKYDRKNYEAFKVSINNRYVLLLNDEMIIEFINTFINFEEFYINSQKFINKAKDIYSKIFKEKQNLDEKWNKNFIEDAVSNFFINNYDDIIVLK